MCTLPRVYIHIHTYIHGVAKMLLNFLPHEPEAPIQQLISSWGQVNTPGLLKTKKAKLSWAQIKGRCCGKSLPISEPQLPPL